MNTILDFDRWLFKLINGLAGHVPILDALMKAVANDYSVFISMSIALLAFWFGFKDASKRLRIQKGVLAAMASLGLTSGAVRLCYVFLHRPRPFVELDNVHLLFYRPTDPSFPAEPAAVLFSIAFSIYLVDKRIGRWFMVAAALQGFSRVFVGVHYPLDIVAGAILGIVISFGVFSLFRRYDVNLNRLLGVLYKFYLA